MFSNQQQYGEPIIISNHLHTLLLYILLLRADIFSTPKIDFSHEIFDAKDVVTLGTFLVLSRPFLLLPVPLDQAKAMAVTIEEY
jgi:hypothetical protein